jgi:hypothetical protein
VEERGEKKKMKNGGKFCLYSRHRHPEVKVRCHERRVSR